MSLSGRPIQTWRVSQSLTGKVAHFELGYIPEQAVELKTAAGLLISGFTRQHMPMLMGAKLLQPLGHPSENGCKYFGVVDLEKLKQDSSWQAKASDAIVKYWKDRNLQRPTESAKNRWPQKRLGAGRVVPAKKPPLRLIPLPKK